MPTFTTDWFQVTARANFDRFLSEFKGKDGLKFLEIGCWEGQASRWLLENILIGDSKLTVIDTFEGSVEHQAAGIEIGGLKRFTENIKEYLSKVKIHQGYSQDILKTLPKNTYDFIYVDGDHRAAGALQDIVISWPLLKKGGIMIMDDYAWNGFPDNKNACVAMDAFLSCFEGEYELLLKEYQIAAKKL
jgi:predicted O-methyltransferase YrrM